MTTQFNELTDSQWEDIKEFLPTQRKRKLDLRIVMNCIFYLVRTGIQWRYLEDYKGCPYKWKSVYYYFHKWTRDGTIEIINTVTNYEERRRIGKKNSDPSLVCVDSQSVKLAPYLYEDRGVDGGKKINGRKRQVLVDTLGLVWCVFVHAANVFDGKGGRKLIDKVQQHESRLKKILIDKGYLGTFVDYAVEQIPGVEVEVPSRPPDAKGFVPEAKRWVVERTFGTFNFFRRLVIDYEGSPRSAESMVLLANIAMNLNRIK